MHAFYTTILSKGAATATLIIMTGFAPQAFADETNSLLIKDFIGTIIWENGNDNIEIIDRDKAKGVNITTDNSALTLDGAVKDLDDKKCSGYNGSYNFSFFGKKERKGTLGGYEDLEDYPTLTLSLPEDAKITVVNSIIFTQGKPDISEADLTLPHCGKINLGNISGDVTVEGRGSADLNFGNAQNLFGDMRGSGDINADTVNFAQVQSRGSGDLELRGVGDADIKISGSGDVEVEKVRGSAIFETSGSGDYEIGDLVGSLDYQSSGSGDLDLETIGSDQGNRVGLTSTGSGDISIGDGTITELYMQISGSTNVDIDAIVRDVVAKTSGSSDIYVDTVTGTVRETSSGSSKMVIDQRD